MGVKPLYYTVSGGRLLFASEIKPLLLALGGVADPDPVAVDFFVSVGYVPGDRTLFKGIRKLLPGHFMRWEHGEPRITKYWDVPDEPVARDVFEEAERQFLELLRESVRLRMISDVPLGAFLSGGVDSSVIVAQMGELPGKPVKTFSIGYARQPRVSELPHARKVAEHLAPTTPSISLTHGDFFENIESFVVSLRGADRRERRHRARTSSRGARAATSPWCSRAKAATKCSAGYPLYRIMTPIGRVRPWRARPGRGRARARLAPRRRARSSPSTSTGRARRSSAVTGAFPTT